MIVRNLDVAPVRTCHFRTRVHVSRVYGFIVGDVQGAGLSPLRNEATLCECGEGVTHDGGRI